MEPLIAALRAAPTRLGPARTIAWALGQDRGRRLRRRWSQLIACAKGRAEGDRTRGTGGLGAGPDRGEGCAGGGAGGIAEALEAAPDDVHPHADRFCAGCDRGAGCVGLLRH